MFSGSTEDEPGVALQLFVNNHSPWSIDFNVQDNNKWNALMISVLRGKVGNVKVLLDKSEELNLDLNSVDLMCQCQSVVVSCSQKIS